MFKVENYLTRPYNTKRGIPMQVRYHMNLDAERIDRAIYGLLDWLGDIGGFFETLSFIGFFILILTQF